MIELPLTEAARRIEEVCARLTATEQSAILTDNGQPSLALLPWDLYETLLDLVRLPSDPHELLRLPEPERRRALAVAALLAERHYHLNPDLTAHDAYADEADIDYRDVYGDGE